jgi:hypothetical protein
MDDFLNFMENKYKNGRGYQGKISGGMKMRKELIGLNNRLQIEMFVQ